MSSTGEKSSLPDRQGALAAAMREVKSAAADRGDVVVEMREAERMRLELFAGELGSVIADVPREIDMFDFAISTGLQPRFWIDAISHVSMGRDKRTFRFVRDTRLGRVVLAESSDMRSVADQVTTYIAERLVERQRLLDGDIVSAARTTSDFETTDELAAQDQSPAKAEAVKGEPSHEKPIEQGWKPFLSGLGLTLLGALLAALLTASYYWEQLDLSRLGLDRFGF